MTLQRVERILASINKALRTHQDNAFAIGFMREVQTVLLALYSLVGNQDVLMDLQSRGRRPSEDLMLSVIDDLDELSS